MQYCSLADINTYLPTDKLSVDDTSAAPFALDAERIIRGYLSGVFAPTTIAAWVDSTHTPELIRSIEGRLIAAAYYSERYSEDSVDIPAYAQNLYNVAVGLLAGIKDRTIELVNLDGSTIVIEQTSLTEDMFLPNSTSSGPVFKMGALY